MEKRSLAMMRTARRAISILAVLVMFAGSAFARGQNARVRVVHASPDAPAVDVLVNGGLGFQSVMFGEVTPYASLRAGQYDIEVVPSGASSPVVIDMPGTSLFYNTDYTVVAVGSLVNASIEPLVLLDDNRPTPILSSRVRFVHASPDAPAVDIAVKDGPVLWSNVSFKGVGAYLQVPSGTYGLQVRLAGTSTVVLELPGIQLKGGTTYTAYAIGYAFASPALTAILNVDSKSPAVGLARATR
jgi:hypothetical protein